jgi:nucleoside phosphorylase
VKSKTRNPKSEVGRALVCFAVKEEAGPFRTWANEREGIEILLTGMGKRNAERAIRGAVAKACPDLVLTCGFAGGLRPDLEAGTVLYAVDGENDLESALSAAGARAARFHCADRVASTAEEKRALGKETGADAVDMESEVICAVCRAQGIPSAIVRVVLDSADEDLPLDFNSLMTPDQRMHYGKLAQVLLKSPSKISALRRFQKQSQVAARRLAEVLSGVLG